MRIVGYGPRFRNNADPDTDLVFKYNADPDTDPALKNNADPDPAFHSNADPDPQLCYNDREKHGLSSILRFLFHGLAAGCKKPSIFMGHVY